MKEFATLHPQSKGLKRSKEYHVNMLSLAPLSPTFLQKLYLSHTDKKDREREGSHEVPYTYRSVKYHVMGGWCSRLQIRGLLYLSLVY